MRRLFEHINFPWISTVYVTVLLYFVIWYFSWLLLALFVGTVGLAIGRRYWLLLLIVTLAGGWIGFVKWENTQQMNHQPSALTEIMPIADSIQVNGSQLSFVGKADGRKFQVFYTLKSEQEQLYWKNLAQNVTLSFEGTLSIPETQRNFNGFDYQKYLATQNIYRLVTVTNITNITPRDGYFDLHLLRRQLILYCQTHFPAPMSSYMTGLLFGYLGKDFNQMSDIYTSLGIIHLFALSGMQVNFFIDLLRRILLRLGLRRDFVDKVQLPFSVIYAFLTGLSVSVNRALLQKNIPLRGLNNFSVTFFILLILQPKFLLTVGGALTMAYSFVLAMLRGRFIAYSKIQRVLIESGLLSIAVLPLLILYFHTFQPLSILLTFIFSVLFDLILLPGLLLIFLVSPLINLSVVNPFFIQLENLIKWVDQLFHFPLVLGTPSMLLFLGLILTAGLLIDFYKHKKRRWLLLSLFIILLLFSKFPVHPSITMIDVGQGDSFLLQDSFGHKNILIDTGGKVNFGTQPDWQLAQTNSNADKTLIPYLKSQGVGTIDTLILTHTDDDHVGDLLALADKIKIRQIWVSQGALSNTTFIKKLQQVHSQVHVVKKGDSIPLFNSQLQVLSAGYDGKGDNNDSIVTYGEFYDKKFLFTGDLEKAGEVQLLKDYPTLKVDVLKAGHHGSKTSSSPEFIAAIHPQLTLISVGLNNRFKHPNQETLDTFATNAVQIYRTDQMGAVKLIEKAGHWQITTVK